MKTRMAVNKERNAVPEALELISHPKTSMMQPENVYHQRSCVTSIAELLQVSEFEEQPDMPEIMVVMNYQGMTQLPEEITALEVSECVRWLYVKRNKITSLPINMCNLKNLIELYLDSNHLGTFPDVVVNLPCLQSLDISSNHVSTLPPCIGQLTSLTKLRICYNQLQTIPPEIGQLINLEVLALTNNNLQFIPAEINRCSNLKHLLLDKNHLAWIPRQLVQLKVLEELSVAGNILLCIPLDVGYMPSLKSVYVDNNPYLHTVPVSIMTKQLGFNSCGLQNPSDADLAHVLHITVKEEMSDKVICLPKELRKLGNSNNQSMATLMELSLRTVFKYHRSRLQPTDLPRELSSLIDAPVASCISCSTPIFSMAFPVIFEGQLKVYKLYRLAVCCSMNCVKLATMRVKLPLVYPDASDLFMGIVPLG